MSTTGDRASSEVRDGYAEIGDQRLHYVEAGEGPLLILLHGFPEFWYGWRQQIKPLAAAPNPAQKGRSGASPDQGAHPGHLGPARSLPRRGAS